MGLRNHIRERTGLILPLPPAATTGVGVGEVSTGEDRNEGTELPLKVTRLSSGAFALSGEGRLKMSLKAVEAVEGVGGLGGGEGNVVRVVNGVLMAGVVREALGVGGSD